MSKVKSKTFEEFYYTADKGVHSINKVIKYYKYNKNTKKYDKKMRCPECHYADLIWVTRDPVDHSYLRKIRKSLKNPHSSHRPGCYYTYDYGSTKSVTQYLNSLNNKLIKAKVQAMMRQIFNNLNKKNVTYTGNPNPFIYNPINKNNSNSKPKTIVRKAIRRKRLDTWVDTHDKNLYLFYGKVRLSVQQNKAKSGNIYYTLIAYAISGQYNQIYSIYRGNIKDNVNPNKLYEIVILGKYDLDSKGKIYVLKSKNNQKMWSINPFNNNEYAVFYK